MAPVPAPARPAADEAPDDRAWRRALREVLLSEDQPRLVFQPIVALQHGALAGYETLARFDGPRRHRPDVWFRRARELGLGPALELKVLRRALALGRSRPADTFVTVNLDPATLVDEAFTRLLEDTDLGGFAIELTEHSEIEPTPELLAALAAVRAAGGLVALDDAGSGYSGLQALLDVRPQLVKLDRALVRGVHLDPAKAALAQMLGEFAGRLDAWLLVEGVEEPEEAEAFVAMGVPLAQGWFFGRPAEPWAPVDVDGAQLARDAGGARSAAVAPLVEAADWRRSEGGILASGGGGPLVVVDARMRPTGVLTPASRHRTPTREALCVAPDTDVAEALERAVTRPADARLDPVVVTDDLGRLVGQVPVDVLVRRLLLLNRGQQPPMG